jgi:hypothetical protein
MNFRAAPIFLFLSLVGVYFPSEVKADEIEESILEDLNTDSDVLVIAFGGLGLNFTIPRFEFVKILSDFNVNILFVKDKYQAYYQYGIETNGNITKTLAILEQKIAKIQPKKILLFGNSSGGYAALLFGFLLDFNKFPVAEVHAFAPRCLISPKCNEYPHIEREFQSLPHFFSVQQTPKCAFQLYYAKDCGTDQEFALSLKCDWIKLHAYEEGGHELVRALKNQGILHTIIKNAIQQAKAPL